MKIPDRREGIRVLIEFTRGMTQLCFRVQYNVHPKTKRLFECFYSDDNTIRHGADAQSLIVDACILISKRIEDGQSFASIAVSLGEDREPGHLIGPPSSIAGAIAWAGAKLERELNDSR